MADLEARLRETDDHAVDARSLVAVLRGVHRTSTSERLLHGTACQQRSYIVDCHVDPAYVRLMVAWHGRLGTQFATMMCDGVAARFMNEAFNARMVEWHGRLSVFHVARRASGCRAEGVSRHTPRAHREPNQLHTAPAARCGGCEGRMDAVLNRAARNRQCKAAPGERRLGRGIHGEANFGFGGGLISYDPFQRGIVMKRQNN